MVISDQEAQKILGALNRAGASKPCAQCGNLNHSIEPQYTTLSVSEVIGATVLGGQAIPCAIVICPRCGAVTLHALGVLGLLPPQASK